MYNTVVDLGDGFEILRSSDSATLTKLEEISRSISLTPNQVTSQMQDVLKKVVKSLEVRGERPLAAERSC